VNKLPALPSSSSIVPRSHFCSHALGIRISPNNSYTSSQLASSRGRRAAARNGACSRLPAACAPASCARCLLASRSIHTNSPDSLALEIGCTHLIRAKVSQRAREQFARQPTQH
jgi:hypothetical protein